MLINCLAVGSGGFIGSVLRYLVGCIPVLTKGSVPFHTLLVNVLGAIFIGLIVGCSEKYISVDGELMLFLKVGLCGGFTTFSTFASNLALCFSTAFFHTKVYLLAFASIFVPSTKMLRKPTSPASCNFSTNW